VNIRIYGFVERHMVCSTMYEGKCKKLVNDGNFVFCVSFL